MENYAAFFSYVRADDEHDNNRLSNLRQMLEDEVQAITGEAFEIFQDDQDIHWGQKWQDRLNSAVDGTTFLIVVVTPRYLKRKACRDELERFLERERRLGRDDLILPILYIETPALSDPAQRAADPLAEVIAAHQWFDWRDLRHEPRTNPEVGKRLEKMAREIEKAMRRAAVPAPKPPATPKPADTPSADSGSRQPQDTPDATKITPRNDPPTLVVDLMPYHGDFTKIMDAVRKAQPGSRILVRPGLYKEALVLDKPLEIIGDGERDEIVVETTGDFVLKFMTEFGRVTHLTLRQAGGEKFYAVDISQGRLELEDCDITSQSLACVGIHAGADPRLRHNRIHGGNDVGIMIHENGKGTLEDNDIFGNALSGVEIKTGSDPVLRRNRIYNGRGGGVMIGENGKGTLEDNDILGNALSGVEIKLGGDPVLRRNRIHDGKQVGVGVGEKGKGTLEDNNIFGNAFSGVQIREGGELVLRRNRIYDGKQSGVYINKNGKGTLEDNDIFENAFSGVEISEGGEPVLRSNRINRNTHYGIYIYNNGGGLFERNDLRGNRQPWEIDESSRGKVRKVENIEK